MRDYESRAVDRLFKKNEQQLKNNLNKLICHTGYFSCNRDEVWQELCILFYQNFTEYYETDRQYLSFLFICLKNRIRNMQKKQYTYEGRFTTDLTSIQSNLGIRQGDTETGRSADQYTATWGQVSSPSSQFDEMEIQEIIQKSRQLLDNVGKEVFDMILTDRKAVKEVNEAMRLQKIKHPTPAERRRLHVLEKKKVTGTSTVSEAIKIIETSIRPTINKSELSYGCL